MAPARPRARCTAPQGRPGGTGRASLLGQRSVLVLFKARGASLGFSGSGSYKSANAIAVVKTFCFCGGQKLFVSRAPVKLPAAEKFGRDAAAVAASHGRRASDGAPLASLVRACARPLTRAPLCTQLVELKNGETYNGHLVSCDNWMNIR